MKNFKLISATDDTENSKKPLVVLMHGYGSDARDLAGLFPALPDELDYFSIQAPIAMPFGGYTWFNVSPNAKGTLEFRGEADEVTQVVGELAEFIEFLRKNHSSVSLLGFSMGMIMATSLMRTFPERYASVVGLSGFVIDRDFPKDKELKNKKFPFFWGRDVEDEVIEKEYIDFTVPWLNEHTNLMKVMYQNIGHSISPAEVKHVGEFLQHYSK
ncbi:MAG: alpha/beta hydrolase-fold protein [Micrococcaceae bacterium]